LLTNEDYIYTQQRNIRNVTGSGRSGKQVFGREAYCNTYSNNQRTYFESEILIKVCQKCVIFCKILPSAEGSAQSCN